MESRRYNYGLTLIEMLVVVATIALLATIIVAAVSRIDNQSKERGLQNLFALLESALQEYHEYTAKFPDQPEKNFANAAAHVEYMYGQLYSVPCSRTVLQKVGGSLLKNKTGAADKPEIYDPWGTVLDYTYAPGDSFPLLVSAGKDKAFGTADDITSKGM